MTARVHLARWPTDPADPRHPDRWAVSLLSAVERERVRRRATPALRAQFAGAHAMLRLVLAEHLGVAPVALAFATGRHGKPTLVGAEFADVAFNLSHSGAWAAVAVCRGAAVGVDVEAPDARHDVMEIAARCFTPAERATLRACADDASRRLAFHRLWTLKEAYLKGVGTGLTVAPETIEIAADEAPPRLVRGAPGDDVARWTLAHLDLTPPDGDDGGVPGDLDAEACGAVAIAATGAVAERRWWMPPA